jgi:hypothetical protein
MKKPLIASLIVIGVAILLCVSIRNLTSKETEEAVACPALSESFEESDLVGTWVGRYFGDVDMLIIHADGTYKQIHTSDTLSFESDWQKWHLEDGSDGYRRLHLEGMRRCDDHDICNTPGGGLPAGTVAINPCEPEYIDYTNEVILFVSGVVGDFPRDIVLRHARLAGSDWNWSYQLQE